MRLARAPRWPRLSWLSGRQTKQSLPAPYLSDHSISLPAAAKFTNFNTKSTRFYLAGKPSFGRKPSSSLWESAVYYLFSGPFISTQLSSTFEGFARGSKSKKVRKFPEIKVLHTVKYRATARSGAKLAIRPRTLDDERSTVKRHAQPRLGARPARTPPGFIIDDDIMDDMRTRRTLKRLP